LQKLGIHVATKRYSYSRKKYVKWTCVTFTEKANYILRLDLDIKSDMFPKQKEIFPWV